MNIKTLLGRAAKVVVGSLLLFTSVSHAQTALYISDGNGHITTLTGLGTSGGTFTFPSGGGSVLTNVGSGTVSLGGNFTTSGGAYSLQFNLTNNTTLTLPTSGTLLANPFLNIGDIMYASATGTPGTVAVLPIGGPGQVLEVSGSNTPEWATVTGTGSVTSVDMLVPSFLSVTGNPITSAGTLAVDYSGSALPVANGGTGQTSALTQYGVLYGSTTSAMSTTLAGTANTVLHGNASGAPTWSAVDLTNDVTNTLPVTDITATGTASNTTYLRGDGSWSTIPAGFENPMTTAGDIIYEDATPEPARLATSTPGDVLTVGATGIPEWDPLNGGSGVVTNVSATNTTLTISPTTGAVLAGINLSNPNGWLATQSFPTTDAQGSAIDASINAASGTLINGTQISGNISGNAGGLSSTLAVASGGTGLTTYSIGDLLVATGTTTLASLPDVAAGSVLLSGGLNTAPTWGQVPVADISATGTASNTTYLRGDGAWSTIPAGFSNPMTTNGDIIYQSGGVPTELHSTNTVGQVLTVSSTNGGLAWQGVVNSIVGSANEVLVSGGSGSDVSGAGIVLSLPQPVSTNASPTFQALTLGDATHAGIIALSNTGTPTYTSLEASASGVAQTYTLPPGYPISANEMLVSTTTGGMSWAPQNAGTVTGSSFATDGVMYATGSTGIASTAALTSGQILVGSTGVAPVPATLGTSNGVSATTGAGTLSIGLGAITPTSVTAQPTTNVASAVIEQTTAATPSADIFDVTASNGTTKYISTSSAGVTTIAGTIQGSVSGSSGSTTGNAATATTLQTARTIAGISFDGSANIELANKFIVQGTSDAGLSGAQFLGALGNGLLKNTTSTGVLSIATAGTDYLATVNASAPFSGSGTTGSPLTIATATSSTLGVVEVDGSSITITGGKISATASAPSFSTITGGTNTSGAAMIVGNTSSLAASGTGTITATAVPANGLTGATLASGVTGSSLTTFGSGMILGTPASGTLTNCTFPTLNQSTTGTAANATGIATTLNSATVTAMYPTFVTSNSTTTAQAANVATALSFVPSTGTLSATILNATANVTSPLVLGGTAATSALTLQSTSATGTTDAINMKVGTNGATTALTVSHAGLVTLNDGLTVTGAVTLPTTSIANAALQGSGDITIQGTAVALGGTTLATTSSPTFGGMTLGAAATQGTLVLEDGSNSTVTLEASTIGTNRTYTLPDAGANANVGLITGTVNTGGVVYASSATAQATSAAGNAGQVLISGGTGTPTWGKTILTGTVTTSATAPSIPSRVATTIATITVTGAAVGDPVMLGMPAAAYTATTEFTYDAYVSTAGTVKVIAMTPNTSAVTWLASQVINVVIIH